MKPIIILLLALCLIGCEPLPDNRPPDKFHANQIVLMKPFDKKGFIKGSRYYDDTYLIVYLNDLGSQEVVFVHESLLELVE